MTKAAKTDGRYKSMRLWQWATAIGVGFIALGSASEAAFLLRDMSVDDYLLTLFYNDERVVAYTWVSLDEGFQPEVVLSSGEMGEIGEFVFADMPLEAKGYSLDDSHIVSYYLENLEGGQAAGLVDTYLGNVQYGAYGADEGIAGLYQAEVNGDQSSVAG
jgi:hypothetical protein